MTRGEEPGSGTDPGADADAAAANDRRHFRRTWWLALGGVVTGVVLALLAGFAGATGADGLRIVLLVSALSTGLAALYAAVTMVVDDLRKRPVGRGRPVAAGVLFLATAALMAMLAGIGG